MPQRGTPEGSLTPPTSVARTGIIQVVHLDAMEHAWEIAPGAVVHGYGYNALVPGPTVEATVGDTLLVRFTNSLPEPTSICWHGPRGRASAISRIDAAASVQPGETDEYRLLLSDAGTFWYHAHPHDSPQTGRGLYGALVVRNPVDPCPDREQVLVFGDHVDPDQRMPLVNGVEEAQILMTAGYGERWRLVNATSATHLWLSLVAHQMTVVHVDPAPSCAPFDVDELALAPGRRLDVVVGPFSRNQRLIVQARVENRDGGTRQRRLATLHISGSGQRSISV